MRQTQQNARSVGCQAVGSTASAVFHFLQNMKCVADHLMASQAAHVCNKPDTTGIVRCSEGISR